MSVTVARTVALVELVLKTVETMGSWIPRDEMGNAIDYAGMTGGVAFALAVFFFVDMWRGQPMQFVLARTVMSPLTRSARRSSMYLGLRSWVLPNGKPAVINGKLVSRPTTIDDEWSFSWSLNSLRWLLYGTSFVYGWSPWTKNNILGLLLPRRGHSPDHEETC